MQQIAVWLEKLRMSEYAERFAENGISVAALPRLTDQDLKDIGVLLGHRRILLAAIGELTGAAPATPGPAVEAEPKPRHTAERSERSIPTAAPSPPISAAPTVAGERRYLTVRRRSKLKLSPRWTWGAPPCGRSKERPGKTTQNRTIAGYSRASVRGTSVAPHARDGVLYCAT